MEIFGWYGTAAILGAYALVSFSLLDAQNIWFQILNVSGGIGVAGVSLHKQAYQPAMLNIVWSIIGLIAIAQILF